MINRHFDWIIDIESCCGTHKVRPRASTALPVVSLECHGVRHGLAARNCKIVMSVTAVTLTLTGVGPIPKAIRGHIYLSISIDLCLFNIMFKFFWKFNKKFEQFDKNTFLL